MTNSGASDPLERIGATKITATDAAEASDAAGAVDGTGAVEASAASETDAIAQALANGEIDPAQAKTALIDAAVRSQLPPHADPALAAEIRAEVEAALEADPTLAALLTP